MICYTVDGGETGGVGVGVGDDELEKLKKAVLLMEKKAKKEKIMREMDEIELEKLMGKNFEKERELRELRREAKEIKDAIAFLESFV